MDFGEIGGFDVDVWNLRGWADWYFTDNTKAGLDVAYWNFDLEGEDADLWTVSLGAEHRFDNTPISAFANVGYMTVSDLDVDAWTIKGGIRIFMDNAGSTLREHDRAVPFDYRVVPVAGNFIGIAGGSLLSGDILY